MRDNPYDFEETVSEYAFPVTENGNKAVTASNLIKAFLFMDKILRYFRCTKIPLSLKSRQILYYLFLILLSTKKAGGRINTPPPPPGGASCEREGGSFCADLL